MIIFFHKKIIRPIAVMLIFVLGFISSTSEYVRCSANTKPEEITGKVANAASISPKNNTNTNSMSEKDGQKKLPENLNYVSDVRLFHAQSADRAKKACTAAGYKFVNSDLNQGTGKSGWGEMMSDVGDGAYVYLGYKTTKNRDDAITSMKMAEMDTDYQIFDYAKVEANMNTGMNILAEDILLAVSEVKKNIEKGDIYAKKVREYLNLFYVPYMDKKGVGDVIFDNPDVSTLAQMLKRSNSVVVSNIFSYLTMGVSGSKQAGYEGNIAERIVTISKNISEKKSSNHVSLDSLYMDDVSIIKDALKTYADTMEPALKKYQDAGGTMSQEFKDKYPEEALCMQAYNRLNEYTMEDGTGVGAYLMKAGSTSLKSKEDIRDVYPLVMAMSPGQLNMFKYTGVFDLANYLEKSENALDTAEKTLKEVKKKVKSTGLKGTEEGRIPIYSGDQDTLYRSQVAMTSEAIRAASAKNEYHKLTQYDKDQKLWDEVYEWGNRVIIFAMAAYYLGAGITWIIARTALKWLLRTTAFAILKALGVPISFLGGNFVTFVIFVVVMIVWYGVNKLRESYRYYNPKMSEVPHYMYNITKKKNEAGKMENYYTLYNATYNVNANRVILNDYDKDRAEKEHFYKWYYPNEVPDYTGIQYSDSASQIKDKQNNNKELISDFNAGQGKKWNGLYVTKSKDAGSPICAENIEDIFLVKKGEYNMNISGYENFSSFGNSAPVNLNSNQYSDSAGGIYLYYKTEDTLSDPEAARIKNGGTYISDFVLVSEKKEKDAKAAMKLKAGKYQFLDRNLTPDQDYYTFLGYTTTTDPDDAIRDLRVDSIATGNSMSGGYRRNNIGYAEIGTTAKGEITMYQTAVKSDETKVSSTVMSYSGAPILADIVIVDSIDKAPAGYEPVISGSGGAAFNFNTVYNKKDNKNKRYIYYQPAVSFVKSSDKVSDKKGVTYVISDEEYLAGIQAFSLLDWEDDDKRSGADKALKKKIKDLGYTPFDACVAGDYKVLRHIRHSTQFRNEWRNRERIGYLAYATTNNPFRAISDIKYYKGTSYSTVIQGAAPSSEGTYMAMDVHELNFESDSKYSCGYSKVKDYSGFQTSSFDLSESDESAESWETGSIKIYDRCAPRGLYTLAADENHPALKPSDIMVTKDKNVPSGMRPISHLLYPYMTENFDISSWHIGAYFYIKKPKEKRKTYISGINVGTYNIPGKVKKVDLDDYCENADDIAMFTAFAGCNGEVLKTNIGVSPNKAWYNGYDGYSKKYSYVGISYTNDPDKAITGIVRYKFKGSNPPNRISIGGVRYDKAGDAVGDYCYYTTKSENANPGLPATEVSFDDKLVLGGAGTILQTDTVDGKDLQKKLDAIDDDDDLEPFEKIIKKAELRRKYINLEAKLQNGISGHIKVDESNAIMTEIFIGHGSSNEKAIADVMKQGAVFVYSYNTNFGLENKLNAEGYKKGLDFGTDNMNPYKESKGKAENICIGYNLLNAENEEAEYQGIRDILITAGKAYKKNGFEKNECEYQPVSEVSLNAGTDGEKLYMYCTWDETDATASPISSLALSKGDSIPAGCGKKRYEYILTDDKQKANLNLGATAVTSSSDAKLIDTRLWLFAHRLDNSVKKKALFDISDAGRKTIRMDVKISA